MSVHENRVGGWDVRYRLDGRQRSKSFSNEGDATAFDKAMKEISSHEPSLRAIREALDKLVERGAVERDGDSYRFVR